MIFSRYSGFTPVVTNYQFKVWYMYTRVVTFFFSLFFMNQLIYAQNIFDSSQCDSRLIQYSWEQKYGGITRKNTGGKTLFKQSTDFMFSAAEGGDKDCAEAYLLVVEHILTLPELNLRIRGNNEEYLVNKIKEKVTDTSEMMADLIANAPTVNALWNEYQQYLVSKDSLEAEYMELTTSIVMSYCMSDYGREDNSLDYDTYMKDCASSWQ